MPETVIVGDDNRTPRRVQVDSSGRLIISPPQERDPLQVVKGYHAAGVAPHGVTQRWLYTVPADRKAIVSLVNCSLVRDSHTGTHLRAGAVILITPNGGAATGVLEAQIGLHLDNELDTVAAAGDIWLHAGDAIDCHTFDTSSAGTISYALSMVATEFDA